MRGIKDALKNERNMRIHLITGVYVLMFSFFYDFSVTQYGVLLLAIALVMACELINTAIETVVNLMTEHFDPLARIAKDTAAGAVLVCAVISAVIGFLLFWDVSVFKEIFLFYREKPILLISLLVSMVIAAVFIKGKKIIKK